MNQSKEIKVGVTGYSTAKFDHVEAKRMINEAYDIIENKFPDSNITVVSGLTNIGVPKIAYEEAAKRNYKTVGIATPKANKYELYPVDEKIIIGKTWGDESETFLDSIDTLVKIGFGAQAVEELQQFKEKYDEKLSLDYKL